MGPNLRWTTNDESGTYVVFYDKMNSEILIVPENAKIGSKIYIDKTSPDWGSYSVYRVKPYDDKTQKKGYEN